MCPLVTLEIREEMDSKSDMDRLVREDWLYKEDKRGRVHVSDTVSLIVHTRLRCKLTVTAFHSPVTVCLPVTAYFRTSSNNKGIIWEGFVCLLVNCMKHLYFVSKPVQISGLVN